MSPREFYESSSPVLLDLRSANRYKKGSLPRAISFPIEDAISAEEVRNRLEQQWPSQSIHVFDHEGEHESCFHAMNPVHYLQGGYTAHLQWQDEIFRTCPIVILGGKAGTGKTEVLQELALKGEQVLDLETLADHKGSVFGNLTNREQPTSDAFRHRIFELWFRWNAQQCVWIEEEGPFLGRAAVPPVLYERMLEAPLIHIERDFSHRLAHIIEEYSHEPSAPFTQAIRKLEGRMGMSANQKALHHYVSGNIHEAFRLLLKYYDDAYIERRIKYRRGIQRDLHVRETTASLAEALIEARKSL